jgi:DNA-binding NtrC family response regulator
LLAHVLGALWDGRADPFLDYVDGMAADGAEVPSALADDLRRWREWSTLPFAEACRRLERTLPSPCGNSALVACCQGWRLLAEGRPREAAPLFGEARRQARDGHWAALAHLADEGLSQVAGLGVWRGSGVAEARPGSGPGHNREQERLRRREACFLACHRHGRMVGASAPFLELLRRLRQAAADRLPLLLVGETGTGKELAVAYLHQLAYPEGRPLVAVNCAGLGEALAEAELFGSVRGAFTGAVEREGLVAQAEGGLLFLDEFGALPPSVQARLLRFLEDGVYRRVGEARERRVELRVAAATCEAEKLGVGFRQDLLHRVAGRVIEVPPLARRLDDLPLLARAFLHEAGVADPLRHAACSPATLVTLARAAWPGNLRQLRHLMHRLAPLASDEILSELRALPPAGADAAGKTESGKDLRVELGDLPLREALARFEWRHIQAALALTGQNKRLAAARLGISLPTLYARLKGATGRGL